MSSSELGLGASPSSHILGCMCEKGHECTGTHFRVFYISFTHIPLAKGDCWVIASEAQCGAIPAFPWLFSPSMRDFNSTSDFLSCRLTSSIFVLTEVTPWHQEIPDVLHGTCWPAQKITSFLGYSSPVQLFPSCSQAIWTCMWKLIDFVFFSTKRLFIGVMPRISFVMMLSTHG